MSQTAITLAFEQWKAQQAATGEPVLLDEFVFALVPGLDPDLPVDRSEILPPVAQIVHRESVTRKGVVNENAVVHSAVLGADVGDFSFNWIGLTNKATGTLAMIVHAPEQQKLKTKEGQQGNVLTRSFTMEFTGAQAETAINTPAETWQIDFTARMAGMDERQRLENMDIYGAAAFFGDGWLVGKTGNQFFVTKGAGYVAGLRAELAANQNITVTTKPVNVWLDVCWSGALTSAWTVQSKLTVTADLTDYEQNGVRHYVFALASIDTSGNITDLRPKGSLDDQQASDALKKHEQSRNHPDATTSEKGFTRLSSVTNSDSETLAATPKAVKAAMDNANSRYSQKGGVLNGQLEAEGDVYAVRGNVCARANPDNKSGGAFFFQKYVSGAVVNTGSLMSESDGGHIQISPTDFNCLIRLNGKAVSTQPDNYRIVSGNRGQFWRFDGSNLYLMFTKEGDPYGTWTNARPLIVSYEQNSIRVGASVYVGGGTGELAADGNVNGSIWGGWLSNWLNARLAEAQNNAINWAYGNCVQDIRLGSSSEFQERGNNERMGGGVMTSWADRGSSNYWIRLRPLQKAVGGNWYTVGYQ